MPNFKRVNYETKPRTVVFATNVIRWQLTITDCSTASRGAALPGTIGSNGVPANLRWTSRAGGLNARRLVPVGELPNEANKTFVFNGANYPSHPRVTAQLYLLGRTQKFLGNASPGGASVRTLRRRFVQPGCTKSPFWRFLKRSYGSVILFQLHEL